MLSPIVACAFLLAGETENAFGADPTVKVTLKAAPGFPLKLTNALPVLPKPQFKSNPEFRPWPPGEIVAGTNGLLAPGLYKTEPFTCLVLVPGRHPDDVALFGGGQPPEPKMRQLTPDLRFIPRR